MQRNFRFKLFFILAVILACLYGIIGLPRSKDELVANWRKNIRLGLDLRGGSYLVVQVNQWEAFNAEAGTQGERLKEALRKGSVAYGDIEVAEAHNLQDATHVAILVKGIPPAQAGTARGIIANSLPQWLINSDRGSDYRLTLRPTDALQIWQNVLEQTKNTIDKKINALGLSEASVQQRSEDAYSQLLIQLPDVGDPGHVMSILQTAAKLELYDVRGGPYASRQEGLAQNGGVLPIGTTLIGGPPTPGSATEGGVYLVTRTPEVRGPDIRNATPTQNQQNGTWQTAFTLSQDAATRFSQYTGSHIGQRLAIVLDGMVVEAPIIHGQISDSGVIEGARDQQAAQDLALNLKAGSLPASISYLHENTVGPSLGADSIRSGFAAGIAGVLAVIVVMLVYYKRSAINATLALFLNALILIACLSYFGAVLTLPGIAGVILTIGMAVDSNVLIFERIREELRAGKGVAAAVDNGFSKALLTIIDTHVTTVVSCAILFLFGSAPIKGFAVTLVIGLIANVFTAVFVSKFIFDWELSGARQATELSI
jgi:preprotein translocase subunit SecD